MSLIRTEVQRKEIMKKKTEGECKKKEILVAIAMLYWSLRTSEKKTRIDINI